MIGAWYKPLGNSTHRLAQQVGEMRGEKATHTGTLDPMAEGVVIILTGEDCAKKKHFSSWEKTYEFFILFGFTTDSHDLLGLTTQCNPSAIPNANQLRQKLVATLPNFIGPQIQQLPAFSAKRIRGKSYFDLARAGENFTAASQPIEIHSLKLLEMTTLSLHSLENYIQTTIGRVGGDFRQKQIIQNWKKNIAALDDALDDATNLQVAKILAQTSKRTYVRALVRDLGLALQLPATTFHITRTQNGSFRVADCLCLV